MEHWDPVRFILQLACILVVAVASGHAVQKYLRLPTLVGELGAGILLGPFALGGLPWPWFGPLFEGTAAAPVSPELQAFSTLAAVLLLFLSGLEADLKAFVAHSMSSLLVGAGGVFFSFFFGAGFAILFGVAERWGDPQALFLGAAASATSIGVAARVLADRGKSASPEGVTIMGAAVLDDVVVILLLAIVLGTSHAAGESRIPVTGYWMILYAIGVWLIFFLFSLMAARPLTMWMKRSREPIVIAVLALGAALFMAGLFEMAGLSLVLGAYVAGLALSPTEVVDVIHGRLGDVYYTIVPIFFCVLGMHVDVVVLFGVIGVSLLYTLVCFASKLFGCGLPAILAGYNLRGGLRIGAGMVPRGEVALIIATLGLSSGAIGSEVFSMIMTMTLFTTLAGPLLLTATLRGGSGLRGEKESAAPAEQVVFAHAFPDPDIAELLMLRISRAFRAEDFFAQVIPGQSVTGYTIRKERMVITLRVEENRFSVTANPDGAVVARLMVLEELIQFEELAGTFREMGSLSATQEKLLFGMTGPEPATGGG